MKRRDRDLVLVVDDTPGSLSFLTEALEDAGLSVLVATDGESALALLDRVVPDVILMDAVMPGLDGFQTCAAMKARGDMDHVPVLFMTGLTETEHVIEGLSAGGVDYVTKPIVPEELIARIRVHLANARTANGARVALDATGRHLMAVTPGGTVLWATPRAAAVLDSVLAGGPGSRRLPDACLGWLSECAYADGSPAAVPPPVDLPPSALHGQWGLTFIDRIGPNELLLRLVTADPDRDRRRLREGLSLTGREAEVLMWLARGKSNRDIAAILSVSPRTVDKHLEQVYAKIGVENRTAAVGIAVSCLVAI
ncbi:response regulator transcription factor [Rhodospira trueperi]|uniref:DNA-binding response regulator, OmpR family, contains REC and winged-helix (WHTH) domain n=1 Tax=Rhodospira trueperi TaxID=69960 RepID=A0A1G7DD13_9PROT|nr:DNA-binding response regulator [Rhodospira trueperi]SDE49421.1 DNA-binding response regulator, OmpR family, contains REC and winged-helix (wHTH) domain [Rhodospira trueperi]